MPFLLRFRQEQIDLGVKAGQSENARHFDKHSFSAFLIAFKFKLTLTGRAV